MTTIKLPPLPSSHPVARMRQALRSAYQARLGVEIAKRAQSKPQKGASR